MSINGIGMAKHSTSWNKKRTQKSISEMAFAQQIVTANMAAAGSQTAGEALRHSVIAGLTARQDHYVNGEAGLLASGVYSKESITAEQKPEFPIETERYKIEDASYIEGAAAYAITDKETGQSLYIREDRLAIQRDQKTGLEFIINMDQPFSYNVTVTGELKGLLNDIMSIKGHPLEEIPLQGGLTVHQDPRTGLRYLAIQGNEAKGMSVVMTSKKDLETLEKLADEFSQYPVCSDRSIAGLYALLEISGNLKREKDGMTILFPNSISYIPYDGNSARAWYLIMPSSDYGAARKYLATGPDTSNDKTWINILPGAKPFETDAKPQGYHRKITLPDAETNADANGQDSKTKSEIIVRPDGSRVLMLTMNVGGMQAAMSLQISEPTNIRNDISGQENDDREASTYETQLTSDFISTAIDKS